jgi:hypothetical protein
MTTFCPNCGTPRVGTLQFCGTCRFNFGSGMLGNSAGPNQTSDGPATWAGSSGDATSPATLRLLAALAWIGCALMTGYLAFVQIGYAGTILDNGSLTALAGWNGLMAALVIYSGVRLLSATKRSTFRQSAIWAVVIVFLQGFQIMQGATHFAYIGSTVAAVGAGVLSFLAYQSIPQAVGMDLADTSATSLNPLVPGGARPAGQRLVIVTLAIIAVAAVLFVYQSIRGSF